MSKVNSLDTLDDLAVKFEGDAEDQKSNIRADMSVESVTRIQVSSEPVFSEHQEEYRNKAISDGLDVSLYTPDVSADNMYYMSKYQKLGVSLVNIPREVFSQHPALKEYLSAVWHGVDPNTKKLLELSVYRGHNYAATVIWEEVMSQLMPAVDVSDNIAVHAAIFKYFVDNNLNLEDESTIEWLYDIISPRIFDQEEPRGGHKDVVRIYLQTGHIK